MQNPHAEELAVTLQHAMKIPATARAFWNAYQDEVGTDLGTRYQETLYFDDNEPSANELAALILKGVKRATASLLWTYEFEKAALPKSGDLSIVTNWNGQPVCIIETTFVQIVLYENVAAEFAAIEGEGDKSLRYWREAHWHFFGRECVRIGREPSLKTPVVCQQFSVIYPGFNAAIENVR